MLNSMIQRRMEITVARRSQIFVFHLKPTHIFSGSAPGGCVAWISRIGSMDEAHLQYGRRCAAQICHTISMDKGMQQLSVLTRVYSTR